PIWSPDGRYITFESDREGTRELFWQVADGNGSAERLTNLDRNSAVRGPESWTRDGKTLLFDVSVGLGINNSIWTLEPGSERKAKLLFANPPNRALTHGAFSPDGRWVAYMSQDLGYTHVFVQPFPFTGAKYQLSTEGGRAPIWSPDGKQLIYNNP